MTTKDAIKLLPLDEKLKLQILNMFDYMSPEQRLTIARIAWKTYDYLQAQKVDIDIEKHIEKSIEGQSDIPMDENFYSSILKEANNEMTKEFHEKSGAIDLANARKAMQQIVEEITASKHIKKKTE
jgi:nicotinate-nucleotide pyrophosphorylase